MSAASSVEEILNNAKEEEKHYEWLKAADHYQKTLTVVNDSDFPRKGEVCESLAYATYKAAFQADNSQEFRERMRKAGIEYEKSSRVYGSESDPRKRRCDAFGAFVEYWLVSQASEKKNLLARSWRLAKEALEGFEEAGNALEYGKTYSRLSSCAFLEYCYEWDFQAGEKTIRDAMECGERAVALLSEVDEPQELARAYVKAVFYLVAFGLYFVPDIDERENYRKKGRDYWQRAEKLSEEAAFLELASTSGGTGDEMGFNTDEALEHFGKALELARKTRDKYFIGNALDWLTYNTQWKAIAPADTAERIRLDEKALQYAADAKSQFSTILFVSPRGDQAWVEAPRAEYLILVADSETDMRKRRETWKESIREETEAIELAENSRYPRIIAYAHHILSYCLKRLGYIETNLEDKKKLLEQDIEHRKYSMKIVEQLHPFNYWGLGVFWGYLSTSQAEMARIEEDPHRKKTMFEEAISNMKHGLQLCNKEVAYAEKRGDIVADYFHGGWQSALGRMQTDLYALTKDDAQQRAAIRSFEDGAELLQKAGWFNQVAECYWNAAKNHGDLGEHLKAAEKFGLASDNYRTAAEKIPRLKDFYEDHARYMQAWKEIERAKYCHSKQDHELAKAHFENAANLHASLKQWNYLVSNYYAWAKVEQAEELSKKEQNEEASKAFEESARLFEESKNSIQAELDKIEDVDEKQMVTRLLKTTKPRREYCMARIMIEEARTLDKKGEHSASCEKYDSATEILENIIVELESEQEQKEIRYIISLSKAWQKMVQAEAETSPSLYEEASELFEEAKELCPNEKVKMLVLGHSRFCKALAAGTRFSDERDLTLHSLAIKYLESAATHYLKADFMNASEYAKGTRLLFDAYVQMDAAAKENDVEKKARLYVITEKLLQTSANAFTRAENEAKKEQVLKLLENVREERELAMSMAEVLSAPIVASTAALAMPLPTSERAVGLEKFEHADVHANIIVDRNELKVGETLDLEIELANAGKGTALLDKIEGAIPNGFEITEKPQVYRVEGSNINLKGRRLEQLKGEDVKLSLRPKHKGMFTVRPVILYFDENGNAKSHELEPVIITVKELGISGWIKGER
jgi:tetratricopeptide (TPR) repeat protein